MKIMKKEKVLEGEVMSEEQLKRSRIDRAALDFLLSPSGEEIMSNIIKKFLFSSRR